MTSKTRPVGAGSTSHASAGSALLDAVKEPIAKVIAHHTPLSAGQVLYVIEYAGSIDLAIAAIDYGCVQNIDPTAAVRAIRAQNAGGEFRRDSDVNSTALLADSGGDK